MFFIASKVFWLLTTPSNFIGVALACGAIVAFTRFRRTARWLILLATFAYLACGFGPVGALLLRPLENRFPQPSADMPAPDGIIILGGAINSEISEARNIVILGQSGSRMTAAVTLARRFPEAKLVFTGGSAALAGDQLPEAVAARRLLLDLGVAPERLIVEDKSRNTYENATFTRAIIQPQAGSHWLLVTSAFHMPRAMGVFRAAGISVTAYPADYFTFGDSRDFDVQRDAAGGLERTEVGLREWIGLIAYRLTGRTDQLLPGPA